MRVIGLLDDSTEAIEYATEAARLLGWRRTAVIRHKCGPGRPTKVTLYFKKEKA